MQPEPDSVDVVPGSERSAQILSVAADLFFTQGFESTSVRKIADALGIRSASLYYHYSDKEQILFELIKSMMEQLTSVARRMVADQDDPEARLAGLVIQHLVMHALRPRETTLGDTELRSLTGVRLDEAIRLRDEYEQVVIETIEVGVAERAFSVPDPKLVAYAVIAQCTHVGIWYDPDGRLPLVEVAADYATFALRMTEAESLDRKQLDELTERAVALHEKPLMANRSSTAAGDGSVPEGHPNTNKES